MIHGTKIPKIPTSITPTRQHVTRRLTTLYCNFSVTSSSSSMAHKLYKSAAYQCNALFRLKFPVLLDLCCWSPQTARALDWKQNPLWCNLFDHFTSTS